MIDSGCEIDLRRLERIVGWEVYGKEEDAALEWTIALVCVESRINHLFVFCCYNSIQPSKGEQHHVLGP